MNGPKFDRLSWVNSAASVSHRCSQSFFVLYQVVMQQNQKSTLVKTQNMIQLMEVYMSESSLLMTRAVQHLSSDCPRQPFGKRPCTLWHEGSWQMYAHSPCVSQVEPASEHCARVFFLAKEVSTVLSQWLSSTPPERKRIPRKPTEASYAPSLRLSTQTFSPNANSLGIMQ